MKKRVISNHPRHNFKREQQKLFNSGWLVSADCYYKVINGKMKTIPKGSSKFSKI